MASHQRFTLATQMQVYFCDPYSPWQRGTNENTNGLLRQYFPKGTDLAPYDRRDIQAVADALNNRPVKHSRGEHRQKCLPATTLRFTTRCCDDRLNPPRHAPSL